MERVRRQCFYMDGHLFTGYGSHYSCMIEALAYFEAQGQDRRALNSRVDRDALYTDRSIADEDFTTTPLFGYFNVQTLRMEVYDYSGVAMSSIRLFTLHRPNVEPQVINHSTEGVI